MDEMESEMVLEVLDPPDRFARPVNPSSLEPARRTCARRCRDFGGLHNMGGSTSAVDDTEFFFRQATLARLIAEPSPQTQSIPHELKQNRIPNGSGTSTETMDLNLNSSFSNSTRCQDPGRKSGNDPCSDIENNESGGGSGLLGVGSSRPTRLVARSGTVITLKPPVSTFKDERAVSLDGSRIGLKCRDKRERNDPQPRTEQAPSKSLQLDVPHRTNIAKTNIATEVDCQIVKNTVEERKSTSVSGISYQDKGKGIDLCRESRPKMGQTQLRPLQLGAPPRNTAQRRLVRNGCISQNNIARDKNVMEAREDDAGNQVFVEPVNGISSHQIHIVSPDSEGSCADKKNKKVIADDNVVTSAQHAKAKVQSGRACSALGKEVTVIADMDVDTVRSEDIGWRTAHNPSDKRQEITTGRRSHANALLNIPETSALHHGSRATSESDSDSKREKLLKGKRKHILTPSTGECSGSTFDDSISCLQSSSQPSNSKSSSSRKSQHHDIMLGPVTEFVEMHSPKAVCSDPPEASSRVSDDNARARQVEADEILARQLQENYYNESPMDATIALSLQEEDAQRSISRQDRLNGRDASTTHVFARPRNYSARSTNRATSTRMAQLRRNFHQWRMDIEARFDYEEMESASDGDNDFIISNRAYRVQRDFNENDYEMLLALDDNNRRGGASETQINSLPQSIVETDNYEEPCVVCLETPVTGDTIRHLPCLHKFHKECIDVWLRRRKSCPICKSGIT